MAKVINQNTININTSADTKQHAVFRRMKQNGQWVGLTPQGYLSARDKHGKAILVPDPERFDFIKSMLNTIYLDYVNNYLTTDKYAEEQGINKDDLLYVHDISLVKALNSEPGCLCTLDGRRLAISIDEIIAPNTVKVVKGEGMPIYDKDLSKTRGDKIKKGDLYIKFNIIFPEFIEEKTHLFHQKIEIQVVNEILRNEAGKVINQ